MTAYDTWIKQGMEKGMEKGIEKGIEKGKMEGRMEGRMEEKIKVIINGWKNRLSINILSNITGLSEERVKKILKDNGVV